MDSTVMQSVDMVRLYGALKMNLRDLLYPYLKPSGSYYPGRAQVEVRLL